MKRTTHQWGVTGGELPAGVPSEEVMTHEVFLSHASGLRSLARGLLRDDDAADDVVQDTWVAAIERRPGGNVSIGAWLRSVTRNIALKRRRGEARRVSRERLAGSSDPLPATDDLVAQRESLQRVVDAVSSLDEVHARVVIMRYFQDLRPREIARRLDVPVATVDSRLHRARIKLRERLDAAAGGKREHWAPALAAATGWEGFVPFAPANQSGSTGDATGPKVPGGTRSLPTGAAGGNGMLWKIGILGGTTLSVAMGLSSSWIGWETSAPGESGEHALVGDNGAEALVGEVGQEGAAKAPAVGDGRVAVQAESELPFVPDSAHGSFEYRIEGQLVDQLGLPVQGVSVSATPSGHPLDTRANSDANGRFVFTFAARSDKVDLLMKIGTNGGSYHAAPVQELRVEAGRTILRRMLVDRLAAVLLPVVRGSVVARASLTYEEVLEVADYTLYSDEEVDGFRWLLPSSWIVETSIGYFEDDTMGSSHGEVDFVDEVERVDGSSSYLRAPGLVPASEWLSDGDAQPEFVRLSGVVRGANGEPASGAAVYARTKGQDAIVTKSLTNAEGRFDLRLFPGFYELVAGGGTFGLASGAIVLQEEERGSEHNWSPLLDRGHEIHGRLIGLEGVDLSDWILELEQGPTRANRRDAQVTADGAFAFPNVEGRSRMIVRAPGEAHARYVFEGLVPGAEAIRLPLPAGAHQMGSVEIRVVGADGEAASADVRVMQVETGLVATLSGDAEGAFGTELPLGEYEVSVGNAAHGYSNLGRIHVAHGEHTTMSASLPAQGQLSWSGVEGAEAVTAWRLYRRGDAVASLVHMGDDPGALEGLEVPAGSYELILESNEWALPGIEMVVAPSETVELSPTFGELHAVRLQIEETEAEGEEARRVWIEVRAASSDALVFEGRLTAPGGRIHLPAGAYRFKAHGQAPISREVDGATVIKL